MADAAMATLPAVGPTGGLPTSGLEALKYAAQADMFQDDPNFYTWLEDWIGKQDEESIMIDAFNTLSDYGMQFEFQQQQQQHKSGSVPEPADRDNADGSSCPSHTAEQQQQQQQAQPQAPPQQPEYRFPGGSSSCASLASQPSSQPSDDASLSLIGSSASPSNDSSYGQSSAKQMPSLAASPSPLISFGAVFNFQAVDPTANALGGSGSGGSGSAAPPAAGPLDAASFTMPLTRGLETFGLPPELSRLMSREAGSSDAASSFLDLDPISPSGLSSARMPSHGTVSSYVGAPMPPSRPNGEHGNGGAAGAGGPAAAPTPPPAAAVGLGDVGPLGRGSSNLVAGAPHSLGTPSLEQLIVRAICGNNSAAGAGAVGVASLGQAVLGGGRMEATLSGMGLAAGAGGSGGSTGPVAGAGLPAVTSAPAFCRNSSGSCGDGAADGAVRSMDMDSPSGSGRLGSHDLAVFVQHHQHHQQNLFHSISGLSAAALHGGGGATRHHGPRRKSSCSGLNASSYGHGSGSGGHHHGHHHGIPVSHAHGHAHVGKAVSVVGAAGGLVWPRGSGGVSATGKPTRSARTKAVFAALEAEVANKVCELEALQREHATLTQRVEILEVALERQNVVLKLMTSSSAANAAGARSAGAETTSGSAGPAAAAAGVALSVPRPLPPAGGSGEVEAPSVVGPEMLEWARKCTMETYVAWYKDHLQNLSLALLALEDSTSTMEAEMRLVQMVAACWVRTSLVCIFQPLTQLRLKGFNLETNAYSEPSEQHWMEVIKFMTVNSQQIVEMENLFHSYNLLHGSFRSELQDTQRELNELVEQQDSVSRETCSKAALTFVLQQTALLKRVRNILQKTHLLYSSTIGVAALRILKPKEFAKCQVQSYPYFPCGPSLMKACFQLRAMKAIWGPAAAGCAC